MLERTDHLVRFQVKIPIPQLARLQGKLQPGPIIVKGFLYLQTFFGACMSVVAGFYPRSSFVVYITHRVLPSSRATRSSLFDTARGKDHRIIVAFLYYLAKITIPLAD